MGKTLLSSSEKVQRFSVCAVPRREISGERVGRESGCRGCQYSITLDYIKDKYIAEEWEDEVSVM